MKELAIEGAHWARCPICNVIWDSGEEILGSWFFRWPVKECDLPPKKLPKKLCPDHVEEIVAHVDGRRKGIKRTLFQDQLNEINTDGLHCPVCGAVDLQKEAYGEDQPGLQESVWICKQCHALIYYGVQFTTDDEDEVGKLAHVFYREDLQTKKELNDALNTICRIIKSKEARSKILCE